MSEINFSFQKMLDDRFGMFVHYGIYSAMGGIYNGREVDGVAEWIQRRLEIPCAEYEDFGRKNFNPRPDFAKQIVASAKKAGARYIVLTSKHHDGFCLFKSEYTDYSSYEFLGRDICKELAQECRNQGIELGFYYSHTLDWYEKDAGGSFNSRLSIPAKNRNFWDYPDENINFEKYLYEKCFPQVKELLTNYGELKLIWFDYPHNITKEQSHKLRDFVKSIQPNCQINSRIGHDCNDYESLGDNALPVAPVGVNLECLVTLNDTWGYKITDNNWKTYEETTGILCRTLASDSVLLLNVGPMGDGSLTPETEKILEKMGEWTDKNSEAVYDGVRGNPFPNLFSWGVVSKKYNNLYLYVTDKSKKELVINTGNNNIVKSVSVLGDTDKVDYTVTNGKIKIMLKDKDDMIPVYKIELSEKLCVDDIYQHGDVLSLGVLWAGKIKRGEESKKPEKLVYEKSMYSDGYGKHGLCVNQNCQAGFWNSCEEKLCWDAVFSETGKYHAYIINSYTDVQDDMDIKYGDGKRDCEFILRVDNASLTVDTQKDGELFYTSRTKNVNTKVKLDAGVFEITKAGKHRILLERTTDGKSIPVETVLLEKVD